MMIETNKRVMHRFVEFINTASEELAAELISLTFQDLPNRCGVLLLVISRSSE
jgi:hypothetical protein